MALTVARLSVREILGSAKCLTLPIPLGIVPKFNTHAIEPINSDTAYDRVNSDSSEWD